MIGLLRHLLLFGVLCGLLVGTIGTVHAKFTVIEAKGGGLKTGQAVDASFAVQLKEGERITLVGINGKTVTLRGPYAGPVSSELESGADRKSALAALVATRDARTSSVGVIRAGADASPLPSPWLIDVGYSSTKCLRAGQMPVWWRASIDQADKLVISPVDRSWRAEYDWPKGQASIPSKQVLKLKSQNILFVRTAGRELGIQLLLIPEVLTDSVTLVAWMLEKGCIQQANALLDELRHSEITKDDVAVP